MVDTINWLDIVFVAIILINCFISYNRGFIISFFKLTSFIVTIILANKIYPYFSSFLRNNTKLYIVLQQKIAEGLNINSSGISNSVNDQINKITELNLPGIIKDKLLENNNYEIYDILDVNNINDYISSYLANITINIISILVALFLVGIGLKVIINMFNLISKLPVLNSINKLLGLLLGGIKGILIVWIICIVITVFFTHQSNNGVTVVNAIENSIVAKYFYNNNWLMNTILSIFS